MPEVLESFPGWLGLGPGQGEGPEASVGGELGRLAFTSCFPPSRRTLGKG
jgi:hypothetical protein